MSRHVKLVADALMSDIDSEDAFDAIALPVRLFLPRKLHLPRHWCMHIQAWRKCSAVLAQGGMPGAERLRDSAALMHMLTAQKDSGRLWSAICAAPAVVLEGKGLLTGKTATCHPAFTQQLKDQRYG